MSLTQASERIWSDHQQKIFLFVREGEGSAIIIAVAGSGKTTTLLEALKYVRRGSRVAVVCFNKTIQLEMEKRARELGIGNNVMIRTQHSVGFGAWLRYLGLDFRQFDSCGQLTDAKSWHILDELAKQGHITKDDVADYGSFVKKLVGIGKNAGVGIETLLKDIPETWEALINHHDIYFDSEATSDEEYERELAHVIGMTQQVLAMSCEWARNERNPELDFDDQLYMPVLEGLELFKNDYLFIDEAQDTNPLQVLMCRMMLKRGTGRLFAFGDPCQAIYGFRGAGVNAIDELKEEFDAIELPLTISYRCPQSVVEWVKQYVPYIEAAPTAKLGEVRAFDGYGPESFTKTDVILCRITAPLITLAYWFIKRKVACRVLGREIGEGLLALVKKMHARTIDELEQKLEHFKAREVAKLTDKRDAAKAQAITDRVDCVLTIAENLNEDERTIDGLKAAIDNLFRVSNGCITLSTAHKSKGLEWERVFILDMAKYMPSKYARQQWQKKQETNLIYVAGTRSKDKLYFLASPTPANEKAHTVEAAPLL